MKNRRCLSQDFLLIWEQSKQQPNVLLDTMQLIPSSITHKFPHASVPRNACMSNLGPGKRVVVLTLCSSRSSHDMYSFRYSYPARVVVQTARLWRFSCVSSALQRLSIRCQLSPFPTWLIDSMICSCRRSVFLTESRSYIWTAHESWACLWSQGWTETKIEDVRRK